MRLSILLLTKGISDTDMNKVLVLGCSGSGKSTFAVKLHEKTNLPLYHLDNIWWKADRTHITRDEFDSSLDELIRHERWIIDGDYNRTYEKRIAACDTIFFLDYGESVCMEGIISRIGENRPDMPWTEDELDPELVELIKNYEKANKPRLMELFAKYPEKTVITFKSREEAESWITNSEKGKYNDKTSE